MQGPQKLKLALDETRMLVLGAQVLLGFQMRSVFQGAFDTLPETTKALDAVALIVMVGVVAMLIAPAIHHRLVDDGNATTRIMQSTSHMMESALLLFAFALGLNMFIGIERIAGTALAIAAGIMATLTGLAFWFGIEWLALRNKDGGRVQMKDESVPLDKKIDQMLTEARVILPGAQALLGFQLAVVLTEAFEKLPGSSKALHAFALGFVALCTILLMAPAAYHRIVYGGEESKDFLSVGSKFIMAATVALALGLTTDVYVVITKIAESSAFGAAAAVLSLAILVAFWHISPLVIRARRAEKQNAGAPLYSGM